MYGGNVYPESIGRAQVLRRPVAGARAPVHPRAQHLLLEPVRQPDVELRGTAAVVIVGVGQNEGDRVSHLTREVRHDAREAEAAVDEQGRLGAVDDEEVPSDELGGVRLGHERHAVADVLGLKPRHSYHSLGAHLTRSTLGSWVASRIAECSRSSASIFSQLATRSSGLQRMPGSRRSRILSIE